MRLTQFNKQEKIGPLRGVALVMVVVVLYITSFFKSEQQTNDDKA